MKSADAAFQTSDGTPGWQNLASDQLIPTPKLFLRTMFSQIKWCEPPDCFSSEPHPSADPNQQ
eukprot:2063694-Prymnesium_polylepis.1